MLSCFAVFLLFNEAMMEEMSDTVVAFLFPGQYMGCVEVLQSMRALDFNTRTQVTR